jgi:HK97 family phage major capsid protein
VIPQALTGPQHRGDLAGVQVLGFAVFDAWALHQRARIRDRLMRHAHEVATSDEYTEFRDLDRVDGSGGYAVPPAWLMTQYIELARPGRAFANLCQRQQLPGGTDSINIPKLLTGTATAMQTADNTPVTQVDLTDTFVNAPVRTIAGQEGLAIQLIDQSPIAFDDVVFRDLVASHAATTDHQVIQGSGVQRRSSGNDQYTEHFDHRRHIG